MTDFQICHFTEGDETFLCNIFNATYEIFNGFSEKNSHQWKASFLLNPQIGEKRIFIARIDNPVGYGAYGKDGIIYDICVKESSYKAMLYRALLVRIIKTATAEGITTLSVSFPSENHALKNIMKQLGIMKTNFDSFGCVKIIDMEKIVTKLNENAAEKIKFPYRIYFKIHQDFTPKSIQYFNGYTAACEVGNSEKTSTVISVECGWQHFGELLFGSRMFWISILTGQLKVRPFKSVSKVKRVMDAMRPEGSWFVPMVDWR